MELTIVLNQTTMLAKITMLEILTMVTCKKVVSVISIETRLNENKKQENDITCTKKLEHYSTGPKR